MRMLLRISIPVEAGNAAARAGTLRSKIEKILEELKPEAAYFFVDDRGRRCGSMVFHMEHSSQMPAISEPWFQAFTAEVSFQPVMTLQDLTDGGEGLDSAVRTHGAS